MPDSVLMPAPVKALMARADRATSISAERDGSVSAEVVVTGRDAPPELIEAADLVTEMTEIKHPFTAGIRAQQGIEF